MKRVKPEVARHQHVTKTLSSDFESLPPSQPFPNARSAHTSGWQAHVSPLAERMVRCGIRRIPLHAPGDGSELTLLCAPPGLVD